ncbi:MAG: serine O-acetyltransferase [Verrucomicrobia bacterium]|nr:MAG: serine O-acetyltransferase [Verrucomicrobiota bacterium]TAE87702.1 MAG: serine O-acetyltransferase [Verrucomicrobiota bacterium]TAF25364.1 MAG: serine O-acetyltransferase [Verrucomicrobiota bacterium]TAF41151.1 MAG: serine O-acetyltransferase [Verrucomicrobiota bacterium]
MEANQHNEVAGGSAKGVRLCQSGDGDVASLWEWIRGDARRVAEGEPQLRALLEDVVLGQPCLGAALGQRLARKLAREDMARDELAPLLAGIFRGEDHLVESAARDLRAIVERDAACDSPLQPLLFFKGFMAISTYRVSHHLWIRGRRELALYFQSLASEVFAVDIHPAARIGCGILLDHATSFVVGETAIIEDDVSILHEVTLGGTGKQSGDRHPIVRSGVLLGAGAKILGRVEIGEGAKVGAGSVVLADVSPHTTVAGVPAQVVGLIREEAPALEMDQRLGC